MGERTFKPYVVFLHPSGRYALVSRWTAPRCTIGFDVHGDGEVSKDGITWFGGPPDQATRARTLDEAAEALRNECRARRRAEAHRPDAWPSGNASDGRSSA